MLKYIVIPALNPDDKLDNLINSFIERVDPSFVILINDGSVESTLHHFTKASDLGCTVLNHSVNMGKGQALKTAFSFLLNHNSDKFSLVCCDADGQHLVDDVMQCLDAVAENTLVIGCRQFTEKSIPLRSRVGNKTTRLVFKMLCGVDVSDTQTGLRAMDSDVAKIFLGVDGSRFEYEMNMLIETKDQMISIIEIPIRTVYIEENKTSHFNPLLDSIRIYRVFSKFLLSSLLGFLVDIIIFTVMFELLDNIANFTWNIPLSTAIARIVSSTVNYFLNKNTVFNSKSVDGRSSIIKYYTLCVAQLGCSAIIVRLLSLVSHIYTPIIKVAVDLVLFIISFQIQREWVFMKKRPKK